MSTIILGVLLLALLAFHAYREHEHDKERQKLLDRLQAPGAAQIAATIAATGPQPERTPEFIEEPLPQSDDALLAQLIGER